MSARERRRENHYEPRCWGLSSDALALFGIGGDEPSERNYPSDPSDLLACILTYRMAPEWAAERMAPVLEKFTAHVEQRYPQAHERCIKYLSGDRSDWVVNGTGERRVTVSVQRADSPREGS